MKSMNSIMMTIYGKMLHFIFKVCLYKLKVCGIEIGVPNVGYKYSVIRDAVLHIVTHGEGVFIYNGKTHTLKEGDMFLLEKGMDVEYKPSFSNPWTYYWIGLSGKQIL